MPSKDGIEMVLVSRSTVIFDDEVFSSRIVVGFVDSSFSSKLVVSKFEMVVSVDVESVLSLIASIVEFSLEIEVTVDTRIRLSVVESNLN